MGKKVLVYAQRRDDALAKEKECTSAHQNRIFIHKSAVFCCINVYLLKIRTKNSLKTTKNRQKTPIWGTLLGHSRIAEPLLFQDVSHF